MEPMGQRTCPCDLKIVAYGNIFKPYLCKCDIFFVPLGQNNKKEMPMVLMTQEPAPVNSSVDVNYSIEEVKSCIEELLWQYPNFFVVCKNGVSHELGTYVFSRPKGVDTPTLRISLSAIEATKTRIDINSSASSFTVTPPDLQIAITEVHNILMAKLRGESGDALKHIIKQNDSGNNAWGCLKTIGWTGCLGIPLLICAIIFGVAIIMFIMALI